VANRCTQAPPGRETDRFKDTGNRLARTINARGDGIDGRLWPKKQIPRREWTARARPARVREKKRGLDFRKKIEGIGKAFLEILR